MQITIKSRQLRRCRDEKDLDLDRRLFAPRCEGVLQETHGGASDQHDRTRNDNLTRVLEEYVQPVDKPITPFEPVEVDLRRILFDR
jgi:hypothetical protein